MNIKIVSGYFLDKNLNITNVIDIGFLETGWFVNFVSSNWHQSVKSIIAIEPSIAAMHFSKRIYGENEKKITYINGFADKAIKDLSKDVYLDNYFCCFSTFKFTLYKESAQKFEHGS